MALPVHDSDSFLRNEFGSILLRKNSYSFFLQAQNKKRRMALFILHPRCDSNIIPPWGRTTVGLEVRCLIRRNAWAINGLLNTL